MPTYEYVCSKCKHQFDVFQAITEKPLTVCPKDKCGMKRWGKGKIKRGIVSGAGILFKGSGFYTTDYRSDSYKEAAKKESPAPASGGEKSAKPKEPVQGPSPAQTKAPAKKPPKEAG